MKLSMNLDTEENDPLESASNLDPDITFDASHPDVKLEPLHQEFYDLSYSCLIVPGLPAHELSGDIKGTLASWVQQICVSFDWRMEFVAVDPQYLQWGLKVPPNMSPGQFMSILRRETSEIITATFPRLRRENSDQEFWAPGYLVINGIRPHPPELIKQFILSVRRQQGLEL